MFHHFREGWRTAKIQKAMKMATDALSVGRMDIVREYLDAAHKLQANTTLPKMMHIEMITLWGLFGMELRELGHSALAGSCDKMSKILQARLDAGKYYIDSN